MPGKRQSPRQGNSSICHTSGSREATAHPCRGTRVPSWPESGCCRREPAWGFCPAMAGGRTYLGPQPTSLRLTIEEKALPAPFYFCWNSAQPEATLSRGEISLRLRKQCQLCSWIATPILQLKFCLLCGLRKMFSGKCVDRSSFQFGWRTRGREEEEGSQEKQN